MVTKFEILRRGAGMNQAKLAEKAGVTRQTISRIERGEIENVSVKTLVKCAEAIGCNITEFFV